MNRKERRQAIIALINSTGPEGFTIEELTTRAIEAGLFGPASYGRDRFRSAMRSVRAVVRSDADDGLPLAIARAREGRR